MDNKQYELRAMSFSPTADGSKVEGYAIVYNSLSEELTTPDGKKFREIIKPGAARQAVAEAKDIPALYAHDHKQLLGRTSSGTLQLVEDSNGVHYSLTLPDTQPGRDAKELVRRGDLRGASFHLKVISDKWSKKEGQTIREVWQLGIGEISLTPYPAYAETSAALRSMRQWEQEQSNADALYAYAKALNEMSKD